jgi:modulator of FtsH protease HflK
MSRPPPIIIEPPRLPAWLTPSRILLGVVVVAVALTGLQAFYTVPQDSVAVVLRFGRNIATTEPGLRFKIPLVDQRIIVPVERQQKLEFGFSSPGSTNFFQASDDRREQAMESAMISGDRNAAVVEWVVQYRITNPTNFLFKVRNPEATLRGVAEAVMREVVGDRTVDEVLTIGRQDIESEALKKMIVLAERFELGLSIQQLQLKDVTPPPAVQASFNEVNQAQQERERLINEARGEYNRAVPRARGDADRVIAEAEGQATRRVNEARGDAERFHAVFTEYEKAPAVTRQRLYLETMAEVLPAFQRRILLDEQTSGVLPFLNLDGGGTAPPPLGQQSPSRPDNTNLLRP